MYTNLDDAYSTYRMLIADGDVDPSEALESVCADSDDDTAAALRAAV